MLEALNHVGRVLDKYVINTFATKTCGEVFKSQSWLLYCNSEKAVYLLRCKICDDSLYFGKAKIPKFRFWFNNYEIKNRSFRKGKQNVPQNCFHLHYLQDCHTGIDDWEVTLFDKCET